MMHFSQSRNRVLSSVGDFRFGQQLKSTKRAKWLCQEYSKNLAVRKSKKFVTIQGLVEAKEHRREK